MNCRFCGSKVSLVFVDLVSAPPSNSFLNAEQLLQPEIYHPLKIFVCEKCWLVQMEEHKSSAEIFCADYAYYSSFSTSWLNHSKKYVQKMIERFQLDTHSLVTEVASNDGYLLQYFLESSIPCVGVEPTHGTACAAREKGVETIEEFWSSASAAEFVAKRGYCDLMLGNNVLAHVPDINDFLKGFRLALKPEGVVTFEFPHLMRLVERNQFDTIYHEHYSYLSLTAVSEILKANGLALFDVEELTTHGGSLRIYAQRSDSERQCCSERVGEILEKERYLGMRTTEYYSNFQCKADKVKNDFLSFLIAAKRDGKRVAAYGAAAKGNTLLNYAGIRGDLLSFIVDLNPAKKGKYTPGTRIPIVDEAALKREKPDFVVILPWNLRVEIIEQLEYIRQWGGVFVTAVPQLEVIT